MIELTTSSRRQQINRITLFGILKKAHFVLLSNVVIITFLKFRWNIGSSKIITYPWPVNIGVGDKSVFSSFFFLLWISEFLHFIRSLPSLRCHLQITVWPTFGLRLLFCCGDTAWCRLSLSLWSVRIEKTLQHCLQSNQRSGCSLFSYTMCCPVAWTVCGRKKLFDLEQCMQKPVKYK